MVGSVGQIGLGRTGFALDLEGEICRCLRVYDCDIEVEEVHLAVLMLVEFGWVDSVLSRWLRKSLTRSEYFRQYTYLLYSTICC